MFPTPRKGGSLDREHIHAVLVLLAFLGQEGRRREGTVNRFGTLLFPVYRRYVNMAIVACFILGEIRIPLAVGTQTLNVELLNNHRIIPLEALAGGQDISVFCDIGTAGEHHIGCRFAHTRRGIDIAAMHTRTLLLDHLAAENMLADNTVGTRQVEDNLCSLNSQLRRWRQRRPEVLADLNTKGIIARAEEQIGTKRHFSAPYLYLRDFRSRSSRRVLARSTSGREPALLVELARVRQVHFRHYTHHLSVRHHKRAVEQVIIHLQGSTHQHNNRLAARIITEGLQLAHSTLLQRLGEEQIRTGIARDT